MPSKQNKKIAAAERSRALREAAALAEGAAVEQAPPVSQLTSSLESTVISQPLPSIPSEVSVAHPSTQITSFPIVPIANPTTPSVPQTVPTTPCNSDKKEYPLTLIPKLKPLRESNLQITTNSHQMTIKSKEVYRYDVRIFKDVGSSEGKKAKLPMFNGQKANDRARQQLCHKLVKETIKKNGFQSEWVAYDGASILYTPQQLMQKKGGKEMNSIHSTIEARGFPGADVYFKEENRKQFLVEFSLNETTPILNTGNLLQEAVGGTTQKNITAMFSIVSSMEARQKDFTMVDNGRELFNKQPKKRFNGVDVREGISASIKVVEGNDRKGAVHMVLDYQNTNFFTPQNLVGLKLNWSDKNEMKKWLKGLRLQATYSTQVFNVNDISDRPIRDIIVLDRPLVELCAEASKRRKTEFNEKNHAVVTKMNSVKFNERTQKREKSSISIYFPIENVKIIEDQKIKHTLVKPPRPATVDERWKSTVQTALNARLLGENPTLANFGATVTSEPVEVTGWTVPTPIIHYKSGTAIPDPRKKGFWTIPSKGGKKKLISVASLGVVRILFNSIFDRDRDTLRKVEQLALKLKGQANDYEIPVREVQVKDIGKMYPQATELDAIEAALISLKKEVKGIVLYADSSSHKTHGHLKLLERIHGVPTKHINFDRALETIGSSTVENLLMGINIKLGGHNFKATPGDDMSWTKFASTLFFSYDVCHSAGGKEYRQGQISEEPSVVGYGYNGATEPLSIIGDFDLQAPRTESVDPATLERRFEMSLRQFFSNRKMAPNQVVVIRDGVSEGQYGMVMVEEYPAIDKAISKWYTEKKLKKPKTSLLIATKRHSHRLFIKSQEGMKNVPLLTAVDKCIVRKDLNEILFVAHHPINGTAHPVLLDLLHNDGVFSSKEEILQVITVLCCSHQSSPTIVSIPDTVYAADEYAKRGSDMFAAYKANKERKGGSLPRCDDGNLDFNKITEELCYINTNFRNYRVA